MNKAKNTMDETKEKVMEVQNSIDNADSRQ
jgi:hypothetical protein